MSIFPFINTKVDTDQVTADELPIFKEFAYDFQNNCLLRNDAGIPYLIERNEALKVWIYKALLTERFQYVAYDTDFGSEISTLVGQNYNTDITNSELKRMIIETLMCNPYLEELKNWEFEAQRSGVQVRFDVTTIYGTERIQFVSKGVMT